MANLLALGYTPLMQKEKTFIYGKHPIEEALKMRPDVLKEVNFEKGQKNQELLGVVDAKGIKRGEFISSKLPIEIPKDALHQGVIAEIDTNKLLISYDDFMKDIEISNGTALVILGEVNDPHNVGAVIRSAAAFGISAVLIPEHRQVQATGTVIKSSAGMAFHLPLVSIGNVNLTIKDLKDKGFWIYGLDGEAELDVSKEGFEKPSVFVLGNEGSGIREKTSEHCDILLRIPVEKGVESLNASVAAGVVFYAWRNRQKS
jgi:23S rRNA (guanosine2251-2'-O)-methyltransferase